MKDRTYRGQVYRHLKDVVRNTPTGPMTSRVYWLTNCADCGAEAEIWTRADFSSPSRRCQLCKAPGKKVRNTPEVNTMNDEHIHDIIEGNAAKDSAWAIAYALVKLAKAQESTANWLKFLGNGNAATSMGAIEAFGMHIGEKIDRLADAIERRGE